MVSGIPPSEVHIVTFPDDNEEGFARACYQAAELYRASGAIVARNLIPISELERVQRGIARLIQLRYTYHGIKFPDHPIDADRFDKGFAYLNRLDRREGGVIYDAARRLMEINELSVHPRMISLSKRLMKTETLMMHSVRSVRIDQPLEDKFLFPWHQDYPYIQDSVDGVVYWIPLQATDKVNGSLQVAIGSHLQGVRRVMIVDPSNENKNGARTMSLADPEEWRQFPQKQPDISFGDVLIFDTLLLHASGPNRSPLSRWALQFRHGNYEHPDAIRRDWPKGIAEGTLFSDRHPEYIVQPLDKPIARGSS